ncbi:putative toxin-antitoxin system toxin component, PIN family [Candidatus Woesearchaeota archaeon]|nr:putative toxin-antitoxin system toxin component, PIN family [Candidatus Woesearchaeota archaeon]
MRLVVDTNVIISALIKNSISRHIITHIKAELITINFSEEEIRAYKETILKKAKINKIEFESLMEKLKEKIILIDDFIILERLEEASKIMDAIDPDDTPFIAAALATNSDIWSDDKHFEKQNKIKVWKTSDLVKLV